MHDCLVTIERDVASQETLDLLAQLNAAFDTQLSVWRHGSVGWYQLPCSIDSSMASDPIEISTEISCWLDRLAASDQSSPQFFPLNCGKAFIAVLSSGDDGEREVVAGPIGLDPYALAAQTAKLATKQVMVADKQNLIDQYAVRLSASFEELSFLRRLSKNVEYCVANRTLATVAESILPRLRDLLDVEALCMIEVQVDEESGVTTVGELTGIVGDLSDDIAFWRSTIDGLDSKNPQVKVRNFNSSLHTAELPNSHRLRSIAIAPVHKNNQLFGWLIAANKRQLVESADQALRPLMNSLGHDELGSMEASLLEATALILGSQAANSQLYQELESFIVEVIHTLVGVVEAKDAYTCGHSQRVALVARKLAEGLSLPNQECENIYMAGLLHDVGKIGVSDDVLLKPGQLTEAEFEQIKQHPVIGAQLIQKLKPLAKLLPGVMYHHESIDGSGYPQGLKGQQIPMMARILAVADAWDAMTSDRPYRPGMPSEKAVSILRKGDGTQWDSQVLEVFFSNLDAILELGEYWRTNLSGMCGIPKSRSKQVPAPESAGQMIDCPPSFAS